MHLPKYQLPKSSKFYFLLALVLFITFFVFSKSVDFEFLNWDDDKQITQNNLIKDFSYESIAKLYSFDKHTSLTLFSYSINYFFSGYDPYYYRIVNIVIHLLNCLLLFVVLRKFFDKIFPVLVATALFAIHPMRVESVVWLSERKDLMFAMFLLLSIIAYIKYINDSKKWGLFFIVATFGFLASVSKIQALTLPVILLICDFYFGRKINIVAIYEKFVIVYLQLIFNFSELQSISLRNLEIISVFVLFVFLVKYTEPKRNSSVFYKVCVIAFLLFLVYAGRTFYIFLPFVLWYIIEYLFEFKFSFKTFIPHRLNKFSFAFFFFIAAVIIFVLFTKPGFWHSGSDSFNAIDRLFLASYSLVFYILKFVAPFNLSAVHLYPIKSNGMLPSAYYFSFVFICVVLAVLLFLYQKRKIIFNNTLVFFLVFFLLNISLVLHIIPIEGRLVVADRYSYFAYIGLFALTGYAANRFRESIKKKAFVDTFILTVFAVLCIQTYNRIDVWKNSETLFTDALKKSGDEALIYNNLGSYYSQKGDFKSAVKSFNKAIEIDRNYFAAYYNRALIYYNVDSALAINDLNMIIKNCKDSIELSVAYNDRGMVRSRYASYNSALSDYNTSLSLNNKSAKAYNNRGWLLLLAGDLKNAKLDFEKAIHYDKFLDDAYSNLGFVKLSMNDFSGAMSDFDISIKLNPKSEKNFTNRGTAFSKAGKHIEAINDFNSAILLNPAFSMAYHNRGFEYFILKDFDAAIRDFSAAIKHENSNVQFYLNRAWTYFTMKNYSLAIADYSKVLELEKENAEAISNLKKCQELIKTESAVIKK